MTSHWVEVPAKDIKLEENILIDGQIVALRGVEPLYAFSDEGELVLPDLRLFVASVRGLINGVHSFAAIRVDPDKKLTVYRDE